MGRGSRIPPNVWLFHTVWVQYPGVGAWVPSLPIDGARVTYRPILPFICPIIDGARVSYPPNVWFLFVHTAWVQYPGVGKWVPVLTIDGARVAYPPNVALLHRVGLVSR